IAISTRWPGRPVTRPAHSPSYVPCPSSSSPSSRKNVIVAGRSSTTMPVLCSSLTAMRPRLALLHRHEVAFLVADVELARPGDLLLLVLEHLLPLRDPAG